LENENNVITTNDGEIDHDSTLNYVANEHVDWITGTRNLYTTGTCTTGTATLNSVALQTGSRVDEIQTTLTDNDEKLPTSGAVVDYVAANVPTGSGVSVSVTPVSFDDDPGKILVTLPIGAIILDITVYVTELSSADPGSDILQIGTTLDDNKYSATTEVQSSIGWQVPTWAIDPTIPVALQVQTTLTADITLASTSEPQLIISVWYTT